MSNKTSDKNVGSIEDDVKRCNELIKVEHANWIGISNQLAISHILAELEQKDKRIKELEKALLKVKDKNTTLFITCRNSIPKQAVIDTINENGFEVYTREYGNIEVVSIDVLQELLGEEKNRNV